MLWSRLFEITKEEKYKEAAIRCAKFSIDKWLNGKDWKIYGGEWDVPGNITSSGVSNVAWGFSVLYRATGYKPALDAVRRSADYLCVQETLFDTEYGRYAPKAFWKGADAKTTGGIVQSSQVEGYGAVLTNQPSIPYGMYLAWKVTGDKMYLDSVVALLVWQMYMQSDNPQDYRFHGGMGEGLQWATDELNGYGCAFHGESIGFSWTLHQLMKDGVLE